MPLRPNLGRSGRAVAKKSDPFLTVLDVVVGFRDAKCNSLGAVSPTYFSINLTFLGVSNVATCHIGLHLVYVE